MGSENFHVGRVGALAFALGVGSAVMGFAATAAADTGDKAGSTGQESTRSKATGPAAGKARTGTRGSAASSAPAAASVPSLAATNTDPLLTRPGRRPAGAGYGVATTNAATSSVGTTSSSPETALLGALLTPVGMQDFVQKTAMSVIGDILSSAMNAIANGASAPNEVAPAIESAPQIAEVVAAEPPAMTAQPDALSAAEADPLAALGGGSGDPSAEPLAWAAMAVARKQDLAGATPEVAPAAAAVAAAVAVDPPGPTFNNPVNNAAPNNMGCGTLVCTGLNDYRGKIQNDIAAALTGTNPLDGTCNASKCTQTGPNYVAAYAFNVVYGLMGATTNWAGQYQGPLPDSTVGNQIVALATQPQVLTYISQTVAANPALAGLSPDAANTIGNAVATFVQKSFGNATVATAFVPFLRGLNLPTQVGPGLAFNTVTNGADKTPPTSATNVFNAILASGSGNNARAIDPTAMKTGLVSFFSNQSVLGVLGPGALTPAVNVLLGLSSANWSGAPSTSSTALADYLGGKAAFEILGLGPYTAGLSATIGGAIQGLITAIGPTVATQAGIALVNFINAPGQKVPQTLGTYLTSATDVYIQAHALNWGLIIPPFGELPPMLPQLAGAAGVAASGFVSGVLSTAGVPAALTTFATQLVSGSLDNVGVQNVIGDQVGLAVSNLLGGGALGEAVGDQVAAAVAQLVADPAVNAAVTTLVGTVLGQFLDPSVFPALATAAGAIATADLNGTLSDDLPGILHTLGNNPAVDDALGSAVSAGVGGFLGDQALWTAVDAQVTSLMIGLLGDTEVQTALSQRIADEVSTALGGQDFGDLVGAAVGNAVVSLLADPAISTALVGLVDTVFGDFFGYYGVIPVLAGAASEAAVAAAQGTFETARPYIELSITQSPAIQGAAGYAVGAAVEQLLGDTAIWTAVDTEFTSVVTGLLGSQLVQDALYQQVSDDVSNFLGGGQFGDAVGDQVGLAVVNLVTSQTVSTELVDLVDTLFTDFFTTTGVVDAFGTAADMLTIGLVSGESFKDASASATQWLQENTDVQDGVKTAVGGAVAQLLGNDAVWQEVDSTVSGLVTTLLEDPTVIFALNQRIASEVSNMLGGGDLGQVVGVQVASAVVGLLDDPVVSGALLGLVDTMASDFFNYFGVVSAFAGAAGDIALVAVTGGNVQDAITEAKQTLIDTPAVDAAAGYAVGDAVMDLLSNKPLWAAVDGEAATLVTNLLGDPAVQTALNDRIAQEVTKLLGGGAVAQAAGAQVADAVVGLLANPVVSGALVALVGSVATDFFSAPGVIPAFGEAADQVTLDVVTGEKLRVALQAAVDALKATPAVQAAVKSTVEDALSLIGTAVLTNTEIQQALGAMVKALFAGLADSPVLQAYVESQLGTLSRDVVAGLIADPAVADEAASAVGVAVTELMAYPGFTAALTDALGQFADAVLDGTPTKEATGEAIAWFQSSPPVVAAVTSVVPPAVESLLSYANVRDGIATAVQEATITALQGAGLNIGFLDAMLGQVAKGTVASLLTRQPAVDLIGTLASNVLLGMPLGDITGYATEDLLTSPQLQIAVGMSLGAGIGSLLGDNILGDVVGLGAGLPIAVALSLTAGMVQFYQWLTGKSEPDQWAPAAQAVSNDSHYFQPLPAAADLYVLGALLPDWQQTPGGQFTVTGLATA